MKLQDFLDSQNDSDVHFFTDKQLLSLIPIPNSITEKIQKHSFSVATTFNVEQTCLRGVRTAIEATGAVRKDFFEGLVDAYQAIQRFQEDENFVEIDCEISDLELLPPGAIVVWDYGENGSAPSGHISIAKGDGFEMSDHVCEQNTTGERPKHNEVYGKKHVFLHKDSFEYDPDMYSAFEERLNTETVRDKMRANHILLLLASRTDVDSMRAVVELAKTYEAENQIKEDEYGIYAEKQLFINLVAYLMNLQAKEQQPNKMTKEKETKQMFLDFFDASGAGNYVELEQYFDVGTYSKELRKVYDLYKPKTIIRSFIAEGQLYNYELDNDEKYGYKLRFGHNSCGIKEVGYIAALIQILYRIRDNAYVSKDKKDKTLKAELILLKDVSGFFYSVIKRLCFKSLILDKHSSSEKKDSFQKEISALLMIYRVSKFVTKTTNVVKKRLFSFANSVLQKISNLIKKATKKVVEKKAAFMQVNAEIDDLDM